jgi:ubiquinone/menaquinone biosynthesis C-methylase UbiE
MTKDIGQLSGVWDNWWGGITPLSEIRMWDYYGGRQWITKYVPRYGKSIEGGCGVGRWVFLLRRFGIDIEGVDFSDNVIEKLKLVKEDIEPQAKFIKGDVTKLPYPDNSLSGYISLGVVEHFIEGPQKPMAEAFRALRPGGIAIISTPNISFSVAKRRITQKIKDIVKKIIGRQIIQPTFFQYEYSSKTLKKYLEEQGFYVSRAEEFDLLYSFYELSGFKASSIQKGTLGYKLSSLLENTFLRKFGGQSITISIKKAPLMYCFLSGELTATPDSLDIFDVPISKALQDSELAALFRKNKKVKFSDKYEIEPSVLEIEERVCDFSGELYNTDEIFENFGFNKNVSPLKLKEPETNLYLSVNCTKPIWRKRKT